MTYFGISWKSTRSPRQASSILIVDGRKKKITFAELTMRGDVLYQQDGPLQASSSARFFAILTDAFNQWGGQSDFSTSASGDFWWQVKIRTKTGKTYRIKGSTAYPPSGAMIEDELQMLCKEAGIRIPCIKLL